VAEYLVELYLPGAASDGAGVATRAQAAAEAMASEGIAVRFLRSILVPEDEICFCLYEAPSAHVVTEAATRAALLFDRVLEAVHVPALDREGPHVTEPCARPDLRERDRHRVLGAARHRGEPRS